MIVVIWVSKYSYRIKDIKRSTIIRNQYAAIKSFFIAFGLLSNFNFMYDTFLHCI